MAQKMATLGEADGLLEELREASFSAAKKELEEVREFARSQTQGTLEPRLSVVDRAPHSSTEVIAVQQRMPIPCSHGVRPSRAVLQPVAI